MASLMNKTRNKIPVVVGVGLSLIGGLAGAALAVRLTHAVWSPFHVLAIHAANAGLEQERAVRANELGRLTVQREQAVAAASAAPELHKGENDLLRAVLEAEAERDLAAAQLKREKAELASAANERDFLTERAFVMRETGESFAASAAELSEGLRKQAAEAAKLEDDRRKQARAERTQRLLASLPHKLTNSIGMKFILIAPGTFTMGSVDGGSEEQPAHSVTISSPYYLGVFEATNAEGKIVKGFVPSKWKDDNHPIETVTWEEAVAFCVALSSLPAERAAGRAYRLPTEAEWEYACRAGTSTVYSFGDDPALLGDYAWFGENSFSQTQPVGLKLPNPWGLHDMHGNVREWCSDWRGDFSDVAATDPRGPKKGATRVLRGGCWDSLARECRSSVRSWFPPSDRYDRYGFRLALSPTGASVAAGE